MSPTETGWNFVVPPPISGRTGLLLIMAANLVKR
jgi:hypothetical protein